MRQFVLTMRLTSFMILDGRLFKQYKIMKETYIKQIADEYKELIPNILYNALYKYEVEITD